jgi:hypothetical protein
MLYIEKHCNTAEADMKDFARRMREQARDHAMSMGERARREAMKRKEDYLGARVSRELRAKVIARADELGIPVSILIRNILEQAFMDDAPATSSRGAMGSRRKADDAFKGVIAWERIVLNRGMSCASCGSDMAAGAVATLGIAAPGEEHVILCAQCKEPL